MSNWRINYLTTGPVKGQNLSVSSTDGTSYVLTGPSNFEFIDGIIITFKTTLSNYTGGICYLQINGDNAPGKPLYFQGVSISAPNVIPAGAYIIAIYDVNNGNSFNVISGMQNTSLQNCLLMTNAGWF